VEYFEYPEIQAVLASVNRNTADGRRGYVLLATMFNTGACVQEIVTLCVRELQLEKPDSTAKVARSACARCGPRPARSDEPWWRNGVATFRLSKPCSGIIVVNA